MTDLKQVVAALAAYVASDSMDVPDRLSDAASVYDAACQAANERLVVCDELLRVNQRSEALRQAQLDPDVLKLYATLDFPGRAQWQEIAQRIGLTVPPTLNSGAARRLNQAYAADKANGPLLRQHRLLALSRAPLAQRVDVVRLLLKAEPTNLGWSDDVRAYEEARYDELRATLADAHQGNTWAIVTTLLAELSADTWVNPPPLDLLSTAQELHDKLRRKQGERVLGELNPRLLLAMDVGDLAAAEDLVDQIEAAARQYNVRGGLLHALRTAEDWIVKERARRKWEREFDQAVEQLRVALDDGLEWFYVQEYYRLVMEFHLPIPLDVAEKFAARARTRRILWALGLVGVIALLIGGAGIYLLYSLSS